MEDLTFFTGSGRDAYLTTADAKTRREVIARVQSWRKSQPFYNTTNQATDAGEASTKATTTETTDGNTARLINGKAWGEEADGVQVSLSKDNGSWVAGKPSPLFRMKIKSKEACRFSDLMERLQFDIGGRNYVLYEKVFHTGDVPQVVLGASEHLAQNEHSFVFRFARTDDNKWKIDRLDENGKWIRDWQFRALDSAHAPSLAAGVHRIQVKYPVHWVRFIDENVQNAMEKKALPVYATSKVISVTIDDEAGNEPDRNSAWGAPSKGVQVRMTQPKEIWGRSDWPHRVLQLRFDARNDGETILHLPDNGESHQVEVDGQWYEWVDPSFFQKDATGQTKLNKLLDFEPGQSHKGLEIELAGNWLAIPKGKEQQYALRRNSGTLFLPQRSDYGKELQLAPAKHRLRVAIVCPSARAPFHGVIRAESGDYSLVGNEIELSIANEHGLVPAAREVAVPKWPRIPIEGQTGVAGFGGFSIRDLDAGVWAQHPPGGWQDLEPVDGVLKIPAGKALMIGIDSNNNTNLAALNKIAPGDLQALSVPTQNKIDNRAIPAIARLTGLQRLGLSGSSIDDQLLDQLGSLKQLKYLSLQQCPVTDAAIPALSKLTWLKQINLANTWVTKRGAGKLQTALPNCKIQWRAATEKVKPKQPSVGPEKSTQRATGASIKQLMSEKNKSSWRVDPADGLRLDKLIMQLQYRWRGTEDEEILVSYSGSNNQTPETEPFMLELEHQIKDGQLIVTDSIVHLGPQRTGRSTYNKKIAIPRGAEVQILPSNRMRIADTEESGLLSSREYANLWEARMVRDGEVVKTVVFGVASKASHQGIHPVYNSQSMPKPDAPAIRLSAQSNERTASTKKADAIPNKSVAESLLVRINAAGEIQVGDETLTLQQLRQRSAELLSRQPRLKVQVEADESSRYSALAEVIEAVQGIRGVDPKRVDVVMRRAVRNKGATGLTLELPTSSH